tara:strand:+ start:774 stop:1304 length:531 start_codon:yes stop_codon:yes gene_type:complete
MKITKNKVKKLYNDFKELETYSCDFNYNKDDYTNYLVSLSESSKPTYPHQGLYFLLLDNYVTYVGMSISSIENRIFGEYGNNLHKNHSNTKLFNSFKVLNLENKNKYFIKNLESTYINMFAPPQNVMLNNNAFVNFMPIEYSVENTKGKKQYNDYTDLISEQFCKSLKEFYKVTID